MKHPVVSCPLLYYPFLPAFPSNKFKSLLVQSTLFLFLSLIFERDACNHSLHCTTSLSSLPSPPFSFLPLYLSHPWPVLFNPILSCPARKKTLHVTIQCILSFSLFVFPTFLPYNLSSFYPLFRLLHLPLLSPFSYSTISTIRYATPTPTVQHIT